MTTALPIGGRIAARCDDKSRTPVVFLERGGRQHIGDQFTIAQFSDAARRIADDPLPQTLIVNVARIGIGREPFAHGEAVAADMM
jgi:hypothetical protein